MNLENGTKLNSNFITNINLDSKKIKKFNETLERFNLEQILKNWLGILATVFQLILIRHKITNYNYSLSGELKKVKLNYFKLSKIILVSKIKRNFSFKYAS